MSEKMDLLLPVAQDSLCTRLQLATCLDNRADLRKVQAID